MKEVLSIRDLYKVQQFQVITDVFGVPHYLRRSEIDKNFKVEMCFGRPVYSTMGAPKIIVTQELKAFILNTLTVPVANFNDVLRRGTVTSLRRLLRDNPYQSYHQWVNSTDANKPDFITFNDARDNPELIRDYLGREYVILSAHQTRTGLVCALGVQKKDFFDKKIRVPPRYILTTEIAEILKKYRFYRHETKDILPFCEQTISFLRSEMGYRELRFSVCDRKAFLASHIQEILDSTAVEFCSQFGEAIAKKNAIISVKSNANFILRRIKEQTDTDLIALLEKYWKTPSDDARKAVDDLLGPSKSKRLRRAFDLLKTAKLI